MMANNWQRLNIWLGLENRFDYDLFAKACREAGVEPQDKLEFAQKAGMVSCGITAHPELPVHEAYLEYLKIEMPPHVSRGLGDTIAKVTHATGLDKLAELYTQVTGKPCGCASRQEALNKLVPYGITENAM